MQHTFKTIQNELVSIIGSHIQQNIVTKIHIAGGYFSIPADVQDCSNKEQLAICVRYVDRHGTAKFMLVIQIMYLFEHYTSLSFCSSALISFL